MSVIEAPPESWPIIEHEPDEPIVPPDLPYTFTEHRPHDEVAETLDAAADWLDEHGWCQGVSHTREDRGCLLHALGAANRPSALMHNPSFTESVAVLKAALYGTHLPSWNDAPERTKEDVTGLLRQVASERRAARC